MDMKRWVSAVLIGFSLFGSLPALAQMGPTVQINTNFKSIEGNPTWLLILRDVDTGRVIPYMYNLTNNDAFYIALAWSHNYRITVSKISWGPCKYIDNFCDLENGVLSGKSVIVRLSGRLTPHRGTATCVVRKYKDLPFTVYNAE